MSLLIDAGEVVPAIITDRDGFGFLCLMMLALINPFPLLCWNLGQSAYSDGIGLIDISLEVSMVNQSTVR